MAEVEFEKCPKYNIGDKNKKDIDALHNIYREFNNEFRAMRKENKKTSKYLVQHMDEEGVHHKAVNSTMSAMIEAIKDVSVNNETLMLEKRARDDLKDKRESIKDKVLAAIAVAMTFGAYNMFMEFMEMRKVITGE